MLKVSPSKIRDSLSQMLPIDRLYWESTRWAHTGICGGKTNSGAGYIPAILEKRRTSNWLLPCSTTAHDDGPWIIVSEP